MLLSEIGDDDTDSHHGSRSWSGLVTSIDDTVPCILISSDLRLRFKGWSQPVTVFEDTSLSYYGSSAWTGLVTSFDYAIHWIWYQLIAFWISTKRTQGIGSVRYKQWYHGTRRLVTSFEDTILVLQMRHTWVGLQLCGIDSHTCKEQYYKSIGWNDKIWCLLNFTCECYALEILQGWYYLWVGENNIIHREVGSLISTWDDTSNGGSIVDSNVKWRC